MATVPEKPEPATSQSPAPSSNNNAEPRLGKTPKELKPWQAWFTTLCIPIFISMFFCAVLGLVVLTGQSVNGINVCYTGLHEETSACDSWECLADEKQSTWLGQSWFGTQWRRLIDFNGFFSAAFLNGGILGMHQ